MLQYLYNSTAGENQMAFGEFKSLKQVLQLYPLKMRTARFLPEVQLEVPE
jgi:hypothetical protein